MLSVLDLAREDTRLSNKSRNELCGPCPDPGCSKRTNGFNVKYDADYERWVFMCRGCWDSLEILSAETAKAIGKPNRVGEYRGWGDDIDYLRHYRNMNYHQANAYNRDDGSADTEVPQSYTPGKAKDYTTPRWQEIITASMREAEARLAGDEGDQARAYGGTRGLTAQTLRLAHAGYSEKDGIPRLLFPVYNAGRYAAVSCRDIRPGIAKEDRWQDVAGGTKDELYRADCLQFRRVTVLCEAIIDGLSVAQSCNVSVAHACNAMINIVSTGGVTGARSPMNIARLALMPLVLIAFDADADGDKAASWWLARLKNAKRLRPFLHDVNDILVDGWDIREWVERAIQEHTTPAQVITDSIPLETIPDRCADCGAHIDESVGNETKDFFYVPLASNPKNMILYCTDCRDGVTGLPRKPVTPRVEQLSRPSTAHLSLKEQLRRHVETGQYAKEQLAGQSTRHKQLG